jgi:hypothetical protein
VSGADDRAGVEDALPDDLQDNLLGTLRSELDEDDDGLHPSFEILAGLVVTVRIAYTSFRISPRQAAEICADLRLNGRDGNEWTVGATSGAWYRRRSGETVWQKSPLPINVLPVEGSVPAWMSEGISARIAAAEKNLQDAEVVDAAAVGTDGEEDAAREGDDFFGKGVINPFQRKNVDESSLPTAVVAAAPGMPVSSVGDVDWILEEWEELDREISAAKPAETVVTRRPAKDGDEQRTERGYLDEEQAPVERAGSDVAADGPVERDGPITPDDYFLRPDD